jgi:hypothetical protein
LLLTSDDVTKAEIDEAWSTGELSGPDLMDALGLVHGLRCPTPGRVRLARARCAEILNARKAK